MKIIYMGTPEFAVYPLKALIEAGHEIVLVVTQPDKEAGRGKKITTSPVKDVAIENNIPVFQPVRIKSEEAVAELKKYEADVYVVAAFGQILSREVLDLPRLGCVNVHASLLPLYRGAAPIQWSIMDGKAESGITLMKMNEGLDTGDIISKCVVPIDSRETGDSLHDKLAVAGAKLLIDTLPSIEDGSATCTEQPAGEFSYAKMLTKDLGLLDFKKSAAELDRIIRALNSWPSAYTKWKGKTLKIWDARPVSKAEADDIFANSDIPGTVSNFTKNTFDILTGEGALRIYEVQLEGKKRMNTADFLRGNQIEDKECLPS